MKQEYDIKKELKRLASIRGSGTELISIYVPPDFQISDEVAKLRDEHSQSSNIKSKTTRLNVQGAIEKIIQYLKLYKQPPKNGLAVFCGNISKEQAKTDIELFSIEPPQPIKANIYRCDSSFLLEPIEAMMEAKDMYALLVMDGREATIAVLKGTSVTVEKTLRSFAHAKVHKGGQSAARYTRAIEESISDYYKEIASSINDVFKKYDFKIKGLVIGGPGPAKENFVRDNELNYQIKVLGVFDTGYTDENTGINELLDKAKDLLSEQAAVGERRIMERFLKELSKNGLATYGFENVQKALAASSVDKLLISEDIELTRVRYRCSSCGYEIERIESGNERLQKHDCGGNFEIVEQSDPIEALLDMADKQGVETYFISSKSQYGQELLLGFKGIAALLKYKI
ncbi:MAG: peptide chain release factor aRF-1 [Candidatus Micrarchaeaceae archaeon]